MKRKDPVVVIVMQKVLAAVVAFISTLLAISASANPTGGEVTAGSAIINQPTSDYTQVIQSTDKAIINWDSFNVKAGETTEFIQPSSSSATLNRINPNQGASQIYGQIKSNGKIILVNQAGVFFGPGAYVDVGGLIASTADIKNENFLAGKLIFDQVSGNYSGSIINQGTIIAASHGLVALVGKSVSNTGAIYAHLGSVVLASGNKFTISLAGDDLISFAIDEAAVSVGTDPSGQPLNVGVSNSGSIVADGGAIIMSAKDAEGLLDQAINMAGVARANSVSQQNGVIILDAGSGKVTTSGKIYARGENAGEQGGTVKVLGNRVELTDAASIDVSGNAGGGTILVGGNAGGHGPEANAQYAYVSPLAILSADAILQGNGGKIVVWSDVNTRVYGSLSARGGSLSGNGGFIETSGHHLDIAGIKSIDLSAPHGTIGEWLLDPTNVYIIDNIASSAMQLAANTYDPSASGSVSYLYSGDLGAALHSANITVTTTNPAADSSGSIYVEGVSHLQGVGAWDTADTTTLTLTAGGTINLDTPIYLLGSGKSLVLNGHDITSVTGTIDGALNLTVNLSGGDATFATSLGSIVPLNSLSVSGANNINFSSFGPNSIITTGAQTYSASAININTTTTFTGTQIDLGSAPISIGSTLTINNSASSTLANTISGAGQLIKLGTGQLTLTAANTYTGATSVNGGELVLSGNGTDLSSAFTVNQGGKLTLDNSTTNVTDRISDSLAFTMKGGELVFKGNNVASNAAETLGALTLSSGDSTITLFGGSGGSTILTFASASRATRAGTVLFRGVGQTNGLAPGTNLANVMFTSAPATVGAGALGTTSAPVIPFAIGDTSTNGNGTDFVTYDATAGVRLLNRATEYSTSTAANGVNLLLDNASLSPDATKTFNSILLTNNSTYTIGASGAAKTLTITSGAIFAGTGTNIINAGAGRTTDTLSTGGVEGKIFAIGTLQHDISSITTAGVGWTKNGIGTYIENRGGMTTGTYGSSLAINNGTMRLGVDNFLTTGPTLTIRAGGTLDYNSRAQTLGALILEEGGTAGSALTGTSGTLTVGNNVTVNTNGSGVVGATISGNLALSATRIFTVADGLADNDLAISAIISGANSGLTKSGAGTLALSGTNTFASTSGVVTISGGTLSVNSINNGGVAGNLGQASSAAGNLVLNFGTLKYTGGSASTDRAFTINAAATGTINVASANTNLTLMGGTANTSGGLTKTGSGTLTLGAQTSYTGTTTVNAGTLAAGVNDAISGGITINNGAKYDIGAYDSTVGAVRLWDGTIAGTSGVLTGSSYVLANGTVSAILGGTGLLQVSTGFGDTAAVLTRANTYSGGTEIVGHLIIRDNAALGSGAVDIFSGGGLEIPAGSNISNSFTTLEGSGSYGTGVLYFQGAGTTTMSGSIALSGAGLIDGSPPAFTLDPNHTVNFTNDFALDGETLTITSNGTNNINFNTLSGDGTLKIDNIGNMSFNAITGGTAGNLNLQLGATSAGALTFNGAIATNPNITISNADSATFNGAVAATQLSLNAAHTITFNNDVSADTLSTTAANYNLAFNQNVTVNNLATFNNTGTLTLGTAASDNLLFNGGIIASAPSAVNMAGNLSSLSGNNIVLTAPLTITDNTTLTSAGGGASIQLGTVTLAANKNLAITMGGNGAVSLGSINGTTSGTSNLTITTGASSGITFNNAIGGGTRLGAVSITATDSLPITQDISTVNDITLTAGGNLSLLNSANLNSSAGNVYLISGNAIAESGTGIISANTLTAQAVNGISLSDVSNHVSTFNATNTTSGDVKFKNSTGAPLSITGIDNSHGGAVFVIHDNEIILNGIVSALTDISLIGSSFTNHAGANALRPGRYLLAPLDSTPESQGDTGHSSGGNNNSDRHLLVYFSPSILFFPANQALYSDSQPATFVGRPSRRAFQSPIDLSHLIHEPPEKFRDCKSVTGLISICGSSANLPNAARLNLDNDLFNIDDGTP